MPWPRALRYAAPLLAIALLLGVRGCVHRTPVLNGSLYIARGGPVIIGWIGNLKVLIDGKPIARDARIVLPEGPVAIATTGEGRLTWMPAGRRGGEEYVPASSLSPDPPAKATFDAPGTERADGLIALAILLVIVGSLLGLARRQLRAVPREVWIAMAAVFAIAVIVRWIDLSGFGEAWDEDVNFSAGRNYVQNLLGLDFHEASWTTNFEHPPIMKYLDGIGALLVDGWTGARALSAVWISLGIALLVPIGRRLFSLRVGVLAAAIGALLPPLIAHGQIVGHESPTVLWWSLGILLSLTAFDAPGLRVRLAWIGVVIGIAIASRFVNGLLGPLCGLILLIQAPPELRKKTLAWGAAILPVVAVLTLYAVWPRLWAHPIAAMQQSFAKLDNTHSPEPFLGAITATPGPHYFLVYLFATLPLGALLAVAAFAVRGVRERERGSLLLLLWFLVPLIMVLSPVKQDGVRYVMPCVTALAMMAAAGVDYLARRVRFELVAGVLVAYLGFVAVRTHPYYLDYFGEQVGGAGGVAAHGWMETAWWGEGLAPAVDYVNAHAAPDAPVYRDCILPAHLAWFRSDLFSTLTPRVSTADWIVVYAPPVQKCTIPIGFQLVYEEKFDGATMSQVYARPSASRP